MASVNTYSAIVLYWLRPDKYGVGVCRDLRRRGVSTPILMLTARDALEDRALHNRVVLRQEELCAACWS